MCSFKLLIVEDEESQLDIYKSGIERYEAANNIQITMNPAKDLDEAFEILDNTFDAAIIDLKLDSAGNEGNQVIEKINSHFRIPVAIVTGTPANVNSDELQYYKVYVRSHDIQEILSDLHNVYKTGITKIIGGRGKIENAMNEIFWKNILPQIDVWKSYAVSGKKTEKALLRFTINHLLELLDYDSDTYLPEEMYIVPPISDKLKTGSIVKKNNLEEYYIVLSPACDLVIRNDGDFKTDRIMLCETESFIAIRDGIFNGISQPTNKKKRSALENLLKNNHSSHYHWLPPINSFPGGFINFRKSTALSKTKYIEQFESPCIQISSHFVKDIVARYSSYYARQGQPDFDFKNLAKKLVN